MNIQFSFRRFWHVLVWTLVYHWRQLLTLFSVAFVTFVAVEIIEFIQVSNDYAYKIFNHKSHEAIVKGALHDCSNGCMSFLALLMCIGAAFAFYNLHRKNEGRQLLMLPATNLEKFMARWVVYVPVLFVLYVVAFIVGDVLRMAVWPVFVSSEKISFPTAIPEFFGVMKYLVVWTSTLHFYKLLALWRKFWLFHALGLFSSVWIGRWAWLFVTMVFFAVTALLLRGNYQGWDVTVFYLLAVVLAIAAYWLFCRFPKYKLFHFKG